MPEHFSYNPIEDESLEQIQLKLLEKWYAEAPELKDEIDFICNETIIDSEFWDRIEDLNNRYLKEQINGRYEDVRFSLPNREIHIKRDEHGNISFSGRLKVNI